MLITTALIATAFTVMAPTASAGTTCGVTTATPTCSFTCNANDFVTVSFSGTGSITGVCAGATPASCTLADPTDSPCVDVEGPAAATTGVNNCNLSGTGAGTCTAGPLPNCDSSNPNYNPTQATHVFAVAGDFGVTMDSAFGGVGVADVFDTSGCAIGDGDNETGQGGAQFPEVSQGACDPAPPVVGHHNGGVGATATIHSNTANLPVDFTFGTDGQDPAAWAAGQTCTGNDVVSDSYDTDPFDCGQGLTGHFPGVSATLAANPNPHDASATTPPDPDPWAAVYGPVPQNSARTDPNGVQCFGVSDGSAWSFFVFGPSINGLITNPPLLDLEGCPVIGDSSSVGGGLAGTGLLTGPLAGNGECGLHGGVGVPTAGASTPLTGTITAP